MLALIITFSILQYPLLQQHQYYQRATAQQQTNNETTSTSNNNTNMTTGTELVPENARGPAIPKDKGYLIQDLGDIFTF